MKNELFTVRNPWFVVSVAALLALLLLSVLVGFIWMPTAQSDKSLAGWWEAVCRAAGAPGQSPNSNEQKVISSDVIVIPQMISLDSASVGRGGTLSLRCTMCHGARGMSQANTPNLAGQDPESIYKQLRDLQTGRRKSEIMAPHSRNLSDQEMRDLAAYYSSLERLKPPPSLLEQMQSPRIVQIGSPMRNIAPCASCHGGSDRKTGSPTLDGEPEQYLRSQLIAFAKGARDNDINGQMRNVARQMTAAEIDTVAKYYAAR